MSFRRSTHFSLVPAAVCIGLLAAGGCVAGGAKLVEPSTVQSVTINPASVTAVVGGPAQPVAATVDVSATASPAVTWTSSDSSVARVAAGGDSALVTGLKAGTATITATSAADSGKHGDATVQVVNPSPATVAISAPASSIAVSATTQAVAIVRDAAGHAMSGAPVTWISANPHVATVSGSGLITGATAGTTSITAASGNAASNALELTVRATKKGPH